MAAAIAAPRQTGDLFICATPFLEGAIRAGRVDRSPGFRDLGSAPSQERWGVPSGWPRRPRGAVLPGHSGGGPPAFLPAFPCPPPLFFPAGFFSPRGAAPPP